MTTAANAAFGQVLKQVRRYQQQKGDGQRADDAGQLRARSGGFRDRRARSAAADRKTLKKAGRQIGRAEPHHLLVGINAIAQSSRIGARKHAGVGERHQRDGAAADQHLHDVAIADPGNGKSRQALGKRTQDRHAEARPEVENAGDDRRRDDGNQNARQPLVPREQQDHRQRRNADPEGRPMRLSVDDCSDDRPEAAQRSIAFNGKAEQLWQLADQHGQGYSVHVAVADRLGEKLGQESQPRDARDDAYRAGDDGHHGGQGCRAQGIAARQRNDDAEDDGRKRRVRSEDKDAARPEQRVDKQRDDRRIEPVDAGQAGRFRIGDADRDQHGREHKPGNDVVWKPRRLISTQRVETRQPAGPMLHPRSLPTSLGLAGA
ncbi:hypothetical protein ACVIST_002474 [Bradyrhizobium elkanii]